MINAVLSEIRGLDYNQLKRAIEILNTNPEAREHYQRKLELMLDECND